MWKLLHKFCPAFGSRTFRLLAAFFGFLSSSFWSPAFATNKKWQTWTITITATYTNAALGIKYNKFRTNLKKT